MWSPATRAGSAMLSVHWMWWLAATGGPFPCGACGKPCRVTVFRSDRNYCRTTCHWHTSLELYQAASVERAKQRERWKQERRQAFREGRAVQAVPTPFLADAHREGLEGKEARDRAAHLWDEKIDREEVMKDAGRWPW